MKTRPSKRARISSNSYSNSITEIDGVDDANRKDDKETAPAGVTPSPPSEPSPIISSIHYKRRSFKIQGCDEEKSIEMISEEHRYAVYLQLIRHIQALAPQKSSKKKRTKIRVWLNKVQNDSLRFKADLDHRNGKRIYAFCCQFHCKCNELQKTRHGWRMKNNKKKRGHSSCTRVGEETQCDNWVSASNSGNGLIHHRQCCHQVNMEHVEDWMSPFGIAAVQWGAPPNDSNINDPLYKKSQDIVEMKSCKQNKVQTIVDMCDQG